MESSFINQMRLTQKQLILQQQRQLNQQQHQHQQQQNFFLDNQNDHKYQHQHPPRCQYYPSSTPTTPITSPPLPHFPPPPEYPPPSNQQQLQQQQHNFHCDFNQQQQQQHQLSPSHCRTNTKKHHQTQDPNSIEICMDYQMNQQQNNQMNYVGGEQSIKWNRNNIAATMERYVPTVKNQHSPKYHHQESGHLTSLTAPRRKHQQQQQQQQQHQQLQQHHQHQHHPNNTSSDCLNDIQQQNYSYAYYDPSMSINSQNVSGFYEEESGSSSTPPPPNSMRALLLTTRRNKTERNCGSYGYGSNSDDSAISSNGSRNQENVYEEIPDSEKHKILMKTEASIVSLNQRMVDEEIQLVQNRHQRTLGELNLSVEEMLMPDAESEDNQGSKNPFGIFAG